jgi:hypothetical protein
MGNFFSNTWKAQRCMTLKIIDLQCHEDGSNLAYTVTFDDQDRGRRMIAEVSESAFFEPAAHGDCEAIDAEPQARGSAWSSKVNRKS